VNRLPTPRRAQKGVALLIVVWVVGLLALLATTLAGSTRSDLRLVRNLAGAAEARALAEAGVSLAIRAMLLPAAADPWRADGTPYRVDFEGGTIVVRIWDEAGKIDVNSVSPALLDGLFAAFGVEPAARAELVDAVLDWRDADDRPRPAGAEADDYRRAGLDHGPRNGPFAAIEEVRLVAGMTAAVYARIAPYITVTTRRNLINPMTAARPVLLALPGVDAATVDAVIARRAAGGVDANPAVYALLAPAERFLSSTIQMSAFTVETTATTATGARFSRAALVALQRTNSAEPYRILAWRPAFARDD